MKTLCQMLSRINNFDDLSRVSKYFQTKPVVFQYFSWRDLIFSSSKIFILLFGSLGGFTGFQHDVLICRCWHYPSWTLRKSSSGDCGLICIGRRTLRQLLCNNTSASVRYIWCDLGPGIKSRPIPLAWILTKYFKKRLSFASGIALAGAASGGLVYGPLIQMLSSEFGISVTFQILSSLQILMFLSALTFVPLGMETGTNVRQRNTAVFDLQVFKNKSYVIWVIAHCKFMVVFLVPFVHLVSFLFLCST